MSSFFQRIFLMVLGSFLTYYVGVLLLEKSIPIENQNSLPGKFQSLKLNEHESQLVTTVSKGGEDCFDDVVGHREVIRDINNMIVQPLQNSAYYKNCSLLQPPTGILLYGPPGTGKTMIARALASSTGSHFLNFDLALIENKLYGESQKMIKAVFTLAHKIKPCIIFVDEIDGVFGQRSILDQSHVSAVKTAFMKELDGFDKKDPSVVLVAATNRKESIDSAILRRLPLKFFVGLPDIKDINIMFCKHLKDFGYKDCGMFAEKCKGMSGSQIFDVCKMAAHRAAARSEEHFSVSDVDVYRAIDDI